MSEVERRIELLRRLRSAEAERDEALTVLEEILDEVSPWEVTQAGFHGPCQICGRDGGHDDDCAWESGLRLLGETR